MKDHSPVVRVFAVIATLSLACPVTASPPDLTNGGVPNSNDNFDWTTNLGPTGLRGWMYYESTADTSQSRQILVTQVAGGSPASGIIAVDDVILGASGTGANPSNFTSDARKSLAYAIQDAEARDPAELKLLRWRSGTTTTVTLTLQHMGAYTATAPYSCPKSALILEQGLQYVYDHESTGLYSFGGLTHLITGDAAHLAKAQTAARNLVPSESVRNQMMADQYDTSGGLPAWDRGHKLIFLAEYYLATGDTQVLPGIEAYAINICKQRSMFGTLGHGFADFPNGAIGGGYGTVNSAGLPCMLGVLLAKECGLTHPELDETIAAANSFFSWYAGKGAIPYGDHEPYIAHETNGKSGLGGVYFGLQDGRVDEGKFFAQMATASHSEREWGHTGSFFNYLWAPLGAAQGGEEAAAAYFAEISWMLDLNRCWNGRFQYDCLNREGPNSGSTYNGFLMSTAALLTYGLPERQLRITGKGHDSSRWLSSAEVTAAVQADTYDAGSRSDSQLISDLAHWSPVVRTKVADELGTRGISSSELSQITAIATNSGASQVSRAGACLALGKIGDSSSASVMAALLTDSDNYIRFAAAEGMRHLPKSANLAELDTILAAAASTGAPFLPLNEEDPMQFAHGRLAMLLFNTAGHTPPNGIISGSGINGVDRNLLYPAIAAVAQTAHGSARATLDRTYENLTEADVHALAGSIVDSIVHRAPSDRMFNHAVRAGGMKALHNYGIAEGVPAGMIYAADTVWNGNNRRQAYERLGAYEGSVNTVNPDPGAVAFLETMVNDNEVGATVQGILAAIAADTNPEVLTPLKNIQSATADQPNLSLPSNTTTLRVNAVDLAGGDSIYTWTKVSGPGVTTITPNGTSATASTVQFDGTAGTYQFRVTMSDSRGLTEVTEDVFVTLSGGSGEDVTAPIPDPVGWASAPAPVSDGSVVYEGFDYSSGAKLDGNGGEGFDSAWTTQRSSSSGSFFELKSSGLSFNSLPVEGRSASRFDESGRAKAERVLTDEAREALLADGTTMWFSVLHQRTDDVEHSGFVFGNGTFNINSGWELVDYTSGAEGFGFGSSGDQFIRAVGYDNLNGMQESATSVNASSTRLVVGKIVWKANGSNDVLRIYNVTNLSDEPTNPIATVQLDINQSSLDRITLLSNKASATYDEVRLGTSFASVMGESSGLSETSITMTAETAYDPSGVEYYFTCVSGGGNDSGWQDSPIYTDTGLIAGRQYAYTVTVRDKSPNQNTTAPSAPASATTTGGDGGGGDYDPPTPNPASFATAPVATGDHAITMTATTGSDASGTVEYRFIETSGNPGGANSAWQSSPTYTNSGLDAGTQYSYTVTMRDGLGNAGAPSGAAIAATTGGPGYTVIADVFAHNEKDNYDGKIADSINGSGMNGNGEGGVAGWPAGADSPDTWVVTDDGYRFEWQSQSQISSGSNNKIGWVVFDLGSITAGLSDFYIWNLRNGNDSYIKTFNVYTASSPSAGLSHGPTDHSSIDYDFASGGWTLINTGGVLNGTFQGDQVVDLGNSTARYVAIEILTSGGNTSKVGLAEVAITAGGGGGGDTDPPTPNPASFASAPSAGGTSSISMVATTGSDASGTVEYLFTETSGNPGGDSSDWQSSPNYTDDGLNASTQYSYTVTMRDGLGNTGNASSALSATTSATPDTTPPSPNPASFASAPSADGSSSISMTASTGSDPSGVEYLFTETSGNSGGSNSGWQSSPNYTDDGLSSSTQYTYTVTMRDGAGNVGAPSSAASATTSSNPGVSIVLNGGFESGFTDWNTWNGPTIDSDAREGSSAVKFVDKGSVNQWITVLPNTSYELSAYMKTSDTSKRLVLGVNDGNNETIATVESYNAFYTLKKLTFTTGPTDTTVKVYCWQPPSDGASAWVDEIKLIQVDTPDDSTPPSPNPASFASAPSAVDSNSITMTATTGSDPSGVEYYFTETSGNPGGSDSGWRTNPVYTDGGLSPDTQYIYTVRMRDSVGNTGNTSASASATTQSTSSGALKVFILAGQSNMQGQSVVSFDHPDHYNGGLGNLEWYMNNSDVGDHLFNDSNQNGQIDSGENWVVRDDVWCRHQSESGSLKKGDLTIGFTGYSGSDHIGLELEFGHVLGDHLSEQVLLVKTAWGGKSLQVDFRPPSSGGTVGPYYNQMMSEIQQALDNLNSDFGHSGGYEIAGFIWQQGWNDMISSSATAEYATNLVNLAADVRSDLGIPNLPFIVGELGNDGPASPGSGMQNFRDAQAAGTAAISNAAFVETTAFARPAEMSPNVTHGHHWYGNAESYCLIGNALAEATKVLLSGGADTSPPTPNPASFSSAPSADGSSSISMTATTGSDPSGVEYLFTETSGNPGGTSSSWQSSPIYTDDGLSADTQYTYTVTMRDGAGNVGNTSASASATTTGGGGGPSGTLAIVDAFGHNEKDNYGGIIDDMINGSGMNGNPDTGVAGWPSGQADPSTWTATDDQYKSEWLAQALLSSASNGKIGWTILDLGSVTSGLTDLYLWNVRHASQGYVKTFNVYVASSPAAAPGHGPTDSNAIDYNFASGGWTQINTGGVLNGTSKGDQVISLGGSTARYIGIEILTNGGDGGRVGIAEVAVTAGGGSSTVTVPNVVNLSQSAAESAITGAGLTVGNVSTASSGSVAAGDVISQTPTGGSSVASGSSVDLVVSSGSGSVTVPDVVGLSQSAAQSAITAAGLTVGSVSTEYSATVDADNIISQGLTPGSSVPAGSAVDLVVSLGEDSSPKLVRTTVNSVSSSSWTTVSLGQTYNSPVIIATPIYPDSTTPSVTTRVRNVTSTGFDLKIDRADGQSGTMSVDVSIIAVDEGVYTVAEHGVKMEAVKFTSTLTSRKGNWNGELRSYQNSYSTPVVVGQIMSDNDEDWSAFWSMGIDRFNPADGSNISVGKHVAEDTDTTRANETIGYIVIEQGSGSIDGVAYVAGLGAETVQGPGNSATPYSYSLSGGLSSASAAAVSISAMDGNNGAWGVLAGNPAFTASTIKLYAIECQMVDSERNHTQTQMSYLVFE